MHLFGFVARTRVYVLCVVELDSIVESLVGRKKEKEREAQIIIFKTRDTR